MSEVKNIPRLRFKDGNINDFPDWEEFILYELGNTLNGLTGKTKDDFDKGSSMYIQYKQVFGDSKIDPNGFGLVDVRENEKQTKIRYGDILFTTSSEIPNEIGMSSVYMSEMDNVYLNSFCFGFRPKSIKDLTPNFSRFLFRSNKLRSSLVKLAQGSTRYNMSKTNFLKIRVRVPSNSEQLKIADFLTAVDKRIELLEKKKTLLETYKKGVMKKIFNQEIRFRDDNGNDFPDWEEKRLEDVFESSKGKGLSKDKVSDHGRHKAVLYGELYTTYKEVAYTIKSYTDFDEGTKSRVGDLLVPCSTTTSNIDLANVTAIMEGDIRLGGDITILRTTDVDIDNIFYSYYLSNHKKYELAKFGQGTTIVHLYYSHFKNMKVDVPCLEEQIKISKFLSSIDNQTELLVSQIDKSKTWKKGLLQKMFV